MEIDITTEKLSNGQVEPDCSDMNGQADHACLSSPANKPETGEGHGDRDAAAGIDPVAAHNVPRALVDLNEFIWNEDDLPVENYAAFGALLSLCSDLYRNTASEGGLISVPADDTVAPLFITTASALAPVIVDRVRVRVIKDGKTKGGLIPPAHQANMLKSEVFLRRFKPLDLVTPSPLFLPDFKMVASGYNDGGPGHRVFYTGPMAMPSNAMQATTDFLGVMDFATNADRTNAVAGGLTVLVRNHMPGAKPLLLVTASKSHAGKDTVINFASGKAKSTSISFQATDWALERCLVGAVKHDPDVGVVVIENARLGRGADRIASAFMERLITDPEPLLFSTGSGGPRRRTNDLVLAISTNQGKVSTDLMNRSLPIHLAPTGNIADRTSVIGNPKLEYLPRHRDQIEAELLGMIERWKAAGMPLDINVKHPFTQWAQTVGGILLVNGFLEFLGNYTHRKTEDDPVRQGLGLLGASAPNVWLRPGEWVDSVIDQGLVRDLIPFGSNESDKARERGIGIVLSAHEAETFNVWTEAEQLILRLEKTRNRQGDSAPATRYRFAIVESSVRPQEVDAGDGKREE